MINVITLDGCVHHFDVPPHQESSLSHDTILLEMIEKRLNIPKNSFRLIPASSTHDSFVLVPIRPKPVNQLDLTTPSIPSLTQIKNATKHFSNNSNKNTTQSSSSITELLGEQMRNFLSRMQAHGGGRSEATLSIPLPRNSDSSTPPPPPAESIARLKEMGFSEAQVIVALRRAHNDEQLAAEYLLGDSDVQDLIDQVDSEDEDDTDDVHGTDSSTWEFDLDLGNPNDILQIVQTVLSTPALQQGLSNPRVVSAFQEMIQNPNTVQNYLNDPEIGPIITQIYNSLQND